MFGYAATSLLGDTPLPTISDYQDALKAIWERSGYDRGFISNPFAGDDAARLGLTRTQALLDHTGHIQLPYEIVHVAGSKGKGSTSAMIDSILRAAGIRTGRYLSPHLHTFRERFVVDNTMISEHEFIALTDQFVQAAKAVESQQSELGSVTAFELNTAMALAWFAQQKCQVAVVEVGMGGELDSTNIVDPTVSVITTLDFEHTAILGSSMAEIARNKAGIIKPSKPVVAAEQPDEAMDVIVTTADRLDAPLEIANRDWRTQGTWSDFSYRSNRQEFRGLSSSLIGQHQVDNAGLAITAVRLLGESTPNLDISENAIRHGLAHTFIPARFEEVEVDTGQTIVIDGAHTPASTAALSKAVQEKYPGAPVALVIGMLADKEQHTILEPLVEIASSWIAVAPNSPRALSVDDLRRSTESAGAKPETADSVGEGIALARQSDAEVILVTGSFSTAAEARINLGLAEFIDPATQT